MQILGIMLVSRARPSHTEAFNSFRISVFILKELNAAVCEGLARKTRNIINVHFLRLLILFQTVNFVSHYSITKIN